MLLLKARRNSVRERQNKANKHQKRETGIRKREQHNEVRARDSEPHCEQTYKSNEICSSSRSTSALSSTPFSSSSSFFLFGHSNLLLVADDGVNGHVHGLLHGRRRLAGHRRRRRRRRRRRCGLAAVAAEAVAQPAEALHAAGWGWRVMAGDPGSSTQGCGHGRTSADSHTGRWMNTAKTAAGTTSASKESGCRNRSVRPMAS